MALIRAVIQNPVKVAVGVLLVALFGLLSIFQLPIQLTPDVDRPLISVETFWEGSSPQEVESEIVQRQEEKLKGIRNLKKMTSISRDNNGSITLEFYVGTDKDAALRDVSEKLRQVTGYPIEAKEPVIVATGAEMSATIAWMILRGAPGEDVSDLKDFVEDDVKPILERAEGIASVDVYGGHEREVKVVVDPYKLAARGLTFGDLQTALRGQNENISAGTIAQGKRDYTYRTVGQFEKLEDVEQTVVAYRQGGPVRVRDIADVEMGFKKQFGFVRSTGDYVLALPARRETGANVLKAMDSLKKQIAYVNKDILHPKGRELKLTQVYDETVYIHSAVDMVLDNIFVGGALTVIVLILFLRNWAATGIVAISIPITAVATFLMVWMTGRSLNVIMLAGLAFAVGMGVDNTIVVMENIFRHRQMGKTALQAAQEGTAEVWGAVFGGTLTNLAVFLPVVFVKEEAGQLFRDLAIAISFSVGLSLVVAGTVVPVLCARTLSVGKAFDERESGLTWRFAGWVGRLVHRINGSTWQRVAVFVVMTGASIIGSWLMVPDADYLPTGNRNLVFGFVIMPPGYSMDQVKQLAVAIEEGDPSNPHDGIRASWEAELGSPEEAALAPVIMNLGTGERMERVSVAAPPMENFFFVSFGGGAFMGATSKYEERVKPLVTVMNEAGARVPGLMTFFTQASLFGGITGGNSIDIEIRGDDLNEVVGVAGRLQPQVMQRFGYARPDPTNYDLGRPEIQAVPDREKAADIGLSVRDVGFLVQACIDGAYVGDFRDRGEEIDLKIHVKDTEGVSPSEIGNVPIATSGGRIVPLASAVNFVRTSAPQQINHIEEMPAVTLTVTPPEGMPLGAAMNVLENEILAPQRASGAIPPTVITSLAGTADKLVQTRQALFGSWAGGSLKHDPATGQRPLFTSLTSILTSRGVIACFVTYLLMAALFESFTWPFVIMLTVPLATIGGFATLRLVHEMTLHSPTMPIQQLDVITMLGFIILVGVVVNNGILLVHQSINNYRDSGMPWREAISESVRTRVRPIFLTAFTSIVGGLPLVLWPGSGSELYRGLGSVMVGGLFVSSVFTLVLIPTTMSLFIDLREGVVRFLRPAGVLRRKTAVPATVVSPAPHEVAGAGSMLRSGGNVPEPVHRSPGPN